ncbi:uncharacterized protein LOC116981508 [Amblyraja radiata]|uniref:uncharacterized protein LOC116981508 n=1 Tax=Amblyraja radiata TaxID=386614 RepID=UPI001402A9E5|nr:uncharacterized protein LOC116981508 [Amblyraja radiata]
MGILLFFVLSLCIRHSFSQSVTQSPNEVTGKECESVTITCLFQEGSSGSYEFNVGRFFKQAQPGAKRQRITTGGRDSNGCRANRGEDCSCTASIERRGTVDYRATYYQDGTGTTVTVTADFISAGSLSPPQQSSISGDTATLNCVYSGFCSYTVHWYRQFPGQALEFLLQRHTSGKQDKEEAAEGRISGSLDPGQKISQLTLSEVRPSDGAVYYCGMSPRITQWHGAVR